jgi:hypothetical protein
MRTALQSRTFRHPYVAKIISSVGTRLSTEALGLLVLRQASANCGRSLGTALAIEMVA